MKTKITKYTGKNNHNWKGGYPHCVDCDKILGDYHSIRCVSCNLKRRWLINYDKMLKYAEIAWNSNKGIKRNKSTKLKMKLSALRRFKNPKNHPRWVGGKTPLIYRLYNSDKNKKCRNKVFKRDNYTCQNCKKRGSQDINSHHKIPISCILDLFDIKTLKQALKCKLLWDINWQITLCKKCHRKINERWNNE